MNGLWDSCAQVWRGGGCVVARGRGDVRGVSNDILWNH